MKPLQHALFSLFALISPLYLSTAGAATADSGIFKEGDRWVFLGDSITAQKVYMEAVRQVFQHFHPEATIAFINSGQGGDRASSDPAKLAKRVLDHQPTVVSVMYGMNEAINNYCAGKPKDKELATYREALTTIASSLKERGITVLFMAPTLTDSRAHSFFNIDKSEGFLREAAEIMREVAKEQGAFYIPVQQEFAAFQEALPMASSLSPDGVHPSALGHYQIARSLWEHTGLTAPLSQGGRKLVAPAPKLPVTATLVSSFIQPDATEIEITLNTSTPIAVSATWSLGDHRSTETLNLISGDNRWKLSIPNAQLPSRNGQSAQILFSLRSGGAESVHILDLCRTAVLHFKENKISGTVEGKEDRIEGKRIANWKLERLNDDLLLDVEVFDSEIHSSGTFPFSRDGLNLMFDYRPTERFGRISTDNEVTQLFLDVQEKPFFGIGVRAWTGQGMDFAITAAGERTATGYIIKAIINRPFKLHSPSNLGKRDFIGLLVGVGDSDGQGKPLTITSNQFNDNSVYEYANNIPIIDLKNKLPGDSIINACLFPPANPNGR